MAIKVECDTCNVDLSETGNSIDHRLCLKTERIPCHEGSVTDMNIYPPIPLGEYHFCSKVCLIRFLESL